jgi:outer membrane protein assembly factor BamB
MQSKSFLLTTATVVLTALSIAPSALAANWPGWRGADGLGIAHEQSLPMKWSATENIRWKMDLPDRGNSTPIVWGERIFLTQALEKENRRTVMCFNRADGRLLWQQGVTWAEKEESHPTNPYCSASPVTDGERVIAWFGSAGVVCYDFNGKELWRRDLGKQEHEWGYGSSPLLYHDLCILYHGPANPGFLIALDKRTGRTVWKAVEPPLQKRPRTDGFRGNDNGVVGSFASPILAKPAGRDEVIMSYAQVVVSYNPKDGRELWRCDGLNELIYASPVAGEDVVVAMGGFSGTSIAVNAGGEGDVTQSRRLWQAVRTKNRLGSGVIHQGHLYVLNTPGVAECVDLKTGKMIWEERLPGKGPKTESWSSMVLANGLIYILNQSSDCIVLKASPKFEVVGVNTLDFTLTNASVVPSDGELFVRTHKHLWCIGTGKRAEL